METIMRLTSLSSPPVGGSVLRFTSLRCYGQHFIIISHMTQGYMNTRVESKNAILSFTLTQIFGDKMNLARILTDIPD